MLKFSYYIDDVVDKAWFDSSNIVYGECDESDTQYKTVRIVFKNGSAYQYENVHVADWVSFKRADSQGKSLNEHLKKPGYKYSRISDVNVEDIEKELEDRLGTDYVLKVSDGSLVLVDNKNETDKYSMQYPGEDVTYCIKEMLESIGFRVKINNQ